MKKGKLVLRTFTAIALSVALALPALAAVKYKGVVSTNKLNVREGPSTSAKVTKSLAEGDVLTLVAYVQEGNTVGNYTANMTFYKLEEGGYIAAKYIKDMQKIETDDAPKAVDSAAGSDTTSDDLDDELSGDLSDDTETDSGLDEIDDEESGLESAEEAASTGVEESQDALEDDIPVESEAEAVVKEASSIAGTVTADALKVRVSPNTNATVVKKLKKGEKITITQSLANGSSYSGSKVSGNWYKINTGGFVSSAFVKATGTVSSGGTVATTTKTVRTGTATANTTMYSKPNTLATKKGTLAKGKSMTISTSHASGSTVSGMKISGNWYKLSNGYYVQSATIKVASSKSSTTTELASTTSLSAGDTAKTTSAVNVRSGPGTGFGKVKLLAKGNTDVVTEVLKSGATHDGKKVSGTWAKLEQSGGYVSVGFLTLESKGSADSDAGDEIEIGLDDDGIPVEE